MNLDITSPSQRSTSLSTSPPTRAIVICCWLTSAIVSRMSGRYDDVLADDMMVDNPVYNLHALGFNTTITGKDNVRNLYKFWADQTRLSSMARTCRWRWRITSSP